MRLIQATVPQGALADVKRALDEKGVDAFAVEEAMTGEYAAVVYVSIPEDRVEPVLEELYRTDLDCDDHVVIMETEIDIFGHAAAYTDDEETDFQEHKRVATAELEGKTRDFLPDDRTFITMMVLSTIVATTGLLLNSAAVVVGAMVIAPLFGPAISTSVGTVIDRQPLFRHGIKLQAVGVGIAVASAAVFAWVIKTTYLIPSGFAVTTAPQIVERLSPDLLSLVIALGAGVAAVLAVATGAGLALVGVMMAAALLPPAATVGIGIAWTEPGVAINSGIRLLVNVLAINFAGLVTLWYLGYRPQSWITIPQTRGAIIKRGTLLFVAIPVTSAFLWNASYASVQRSQLEENIEEDIEDLLSADRYTTVSLLDVKVDQDRTSLLSEPEEVVVTVGQPPGERYPDLHGNVTERIEARTGEEIDVELRVSLIMTESEAE